MSAERVERTLGLLCPQQLGPTPPPPHGTHLNFHTLPETRAALNEAGDVVFIAGVTLSARAMLIKHASRGEAAKHNQMP